MGELIEVYGNIKWLDVEKGYGLIVKEKKGMKDIIMKVN